MTPLAYVDTETTGLDARIHQPYEVCIWRANAPDPVTLWLPHTLEFANQESLLIGGYWDRGAEGPWEAADGGDSVTNLLIRLLRGATLVGSNPGFDAAMLTRFIGTQVWHHRHINVADGAMYLFGWDRPKGLDVIRTELVARGHVIPEPDHTAEGDVRCTRAVHYALRAEAQR